MPNPTTKISGKLRPHKPKIPTGFSLTSTTIEDGNDAVAYAGMFRGIDPSYAIPRDAINADLRTYGSPFERLLGDEFVSAAESQINLLQSVTALVGGNLVNNNAVTFSQEITDDESAMWEQTVANFLSSSSQYLSLATQSSVQVGTGSYIVSIAFKTSVQNTLQYLFSYGSHVTAKAYYEMFFDANGRINFAQWDATHTDTITDTYPNRWNDNRWHIATALIDRTLNVVTFMVDGVLIGTPTTVTATSTLTIAGESLLIGANKSSGGSIGNYFTGLLSLFKLVNNAADYNVPTIWNMGTQEALSNGTFTTPTLDANKRLNNKYGLPNTSGSYSYAIVDLEDGEYEIQVIYEKNSSNGILQLLIDGNAVIPSLDTYNGSLTHDNLSRTFGVKISNGKHLIKLLTNTKNASSTGYAVNIEWINFIKRRGHEKGGLVRAVLFGDEIIERYSNVNGMTLTSKATAWFNNTFGQTSSPANNDYTEGTLFFRGGLYSILISACGDGSTGANLNLRIGSSGADGDPLEISPSGSSPLSSLPFFIRLPQGRYPVRITATTLSGNQMFLTSIRFERVSD